MEFTLRISCQDSLILTCLPWCTLVFTTISLPYFYVFTLVKIWRAPGISMLHASEKKILSRMCQFSHFQIFSIFKICVGQGCLEEPGRDCSMPLGGGPDGLQHELGGPRGRISGSWPPETSIPGVTCWLHLLKQITTTDVSFFFIFTEPSQIYFQMQRIFLYNLCINITKRNWGCLEITSVWWENGVLALKENSQ